MFIVDTILAFPSLVLTLALVVYLGHNLVVVIIAIAIHSLPTYARIARANTLTLARREFVLAARASGARDGTILGREILPVLLPSILAYALIAMGLAIVVEGSLSFLGLSVALPTPSWGGLIAAGQRLLRVDAYQVAIPAVVLFLTVLSANYVGDSVRRVSDRQVSRLQ